MYRTDEILKWAFLIIFWVIFFSLSMLHVLPTAKSSSGSRQNYLDYPLLHHRGRYIKSRHRTSEIGFKFWNDPGELTDSINGVACTFVIAETLYAGTENANPRQAFPRAITQVFWRMADSNLLRR